METAQVTERFAFGENWQRFLDVVDDRRIADAERSLREKLHIETLEDKRFLDAGSGSGLFSLAARRLGATVHSFDYDPRSVACASELKRRFRPDDAQWTIEQGSVLDQDYLSTLGRFDVVYSWGVLHHTGRMWDACSRIIDTVAPDGRLFIAIYNDQGAVSRYWSWVKRAYNRNAFAKYAMTVIHLPYLLVAPWLLRALTGRLTLYRGMSMWHDVVDWLGGYPFEVARPEAILAFFRQRGFVLEELQTCGGRMGCNEYVFHRADVPQ
ncbi:MAG: class I SAM-dependent methyltransferase [Thermoanaerobaculia bacterium]